MATKTNGRKLHGNINLDSGGYLHNVMATNTSVASAAAADHAAQVATTSPIFKSEALIRCKLYVRCTFQTTNQGPKATRTQKNVRA